MGFIPFWIFIAVCIAAAAIVSSIRKVRFVDTQVIVMAVAAGFTCDMIFCKWLSLYHWVNMELGGFYSLWVCLIIYPCVTLVFLKFSPERLDRIAVYILLWSLSLTLAELYIFRPLEIVLYPAWRIIPWSPIGYVLVFTGLLAYRKLLERKIEVLKN